MSAELLAMLDRAQKNSQAKTVNTNIQVEEGRDIRKNTVTKSHSLTRAYYRFGLVEKRCMEALISKLNPLRTDNPPEIELTAKEYAQAYGVSQKVAYRDISSAADALMNNVMTADLASGKAGDKEKFHLMRKAKYYPSEGRIVCIFSVDAMPLLTGLGFGGKFSSYTLMKAVDFRSSYTWRFYELLSSWSDAKAFKGRFGGWINDQSVAELRGLMDMPDSYRWINVQRVLDKVTEEIKRELNVHVFIERKKTNRKITHLDIKFIENDQQQLELREKAKA